MAPLEHIFGFPNKSVEEYNTFDLKVVFTKKSDSLLYCYTSFMSSERHFHHSQLGQWKPSVICYVLGSTYVFNEIT